MCVYIYTDRNVRWTLNVATNAKNTCHGVRHFCFSFLNDGP